MLREERDVFAPLAERRDTQRKDLEAIVEVLAEVALGDVFLEVPVGRGDDPHVHPPLLGGAERANLAFLQHAQELRLEREGHLRHFVEKERAAVGNLEEALLVFVGAGEAALAMPEELALEEVLGHRRAVLAHEELVAPPRPVVHRRRR